MTALDIEFEFLYPNGNDASKIFGRTLQSSLEELGIKLNLATLEWATFLQRIKSREFDSCNLAWIPPLESDPEQLWHSKWGVRDIQSSNNSGMQDPKVDALIAKISPDMINWDFDMGDDITAMSDKNPDDPDHITVTFPLDGGFENDERLFFRIEKR